MARKITIAQKNMVKKLLSNARTALHSVEALNDTGVLEPAACQHLENMALDLIGALREYQRSTNVLFTQGQKS